MRFKIFAVLLFVCGVAFGQSTSAPLGGDGGSTSYTVPAASGSGSGSTNTVVAGTAGEITVTTVGLSNTVSKTAVGTAGTYGSATQVGQVVTDSKGTVTNAANVTIAIAASQVTGTAVTNADARLSDSRTPTAHATSHKTGGSDSIKLDELAAPTDVTTLNASTTAHGLAPKYPNDATKYLDGTGGYTVPAGGNSTAALTTNANTFSAGFSQTINGSIVLPFTSTNTVTTGVRQGIIWKSGGAQGTKTFLHDYNQNMGDGYESIYLGYNAGNTNTANTSFCNVGIGKDVMKAVTSGSYNEIISFEQTTLTTGTGNTGVGHRACGGVASTSYNTEMGYNDGASPGGRSLNFTFGKNNGYTSTGSGALRMGAFGNENTWTTAGQTNSLAVGQQVNMSSPNTIYLSSTNGNTYRQNVVIGKASAAASFDNGGSTSLGTDASVFQGIKSATATLNFTSDLVAGTQQALTIAVSGATTNDNPIYGWPVNYDAMCAKSTWDMTVVSNGFVNVIRTGKAADTDDYNVTFRATVIKWVTP